MPTAFLGASSIQPRGSDQFLSAEPTGNARNGIIECCSILFSVNLCLFIFWFSTKATDKNQTIFESRSMEQSIATATARFQHRDLSILVGILSGTLLVVFASENPLSNFQPIDLVIFFAVPALAGAIAGFTSSGRSMESGAIVGVVIGLVYGILNGLRLGASMAGEQVLFLESGSAMARRHPTNGTRPGAEDLRELQDR